MDSVWPRSRNRTWAPDTNLSVFSLAIEFKAASPKAAYTYYALKVCISPETGKYLLYSEALHESWDFDYTLTSKKFQIQYI